jgi:hypothetical protein
MEQGMFLSALRFLRRNNTRTRRERKRQSRRRRLIPVVPAEVLEDRVLLAAEIRTWDGGGATPDFDLDANWQPDTAPDNDDIANFVTAGHAHVFGFASIMLLVGVILTNAAANAASGDEKRAGARKSGTLVTYRFVATITANGSATPFKTGTKMSGEFRYDVASKDRKPDDLKHGSFESPKNRIVFNYGKLRFEGKGRVRVNTGHYRQIVEHFQIVSFDLRLPKGWKRIQVPGKVDRSSTFSVLLQNAPPAGVFINDKLPQKLELSKFKNCRVRMDFHHGVIYPGGVVRKRAIIEAKLEALRPVSKRD